LNVEAQVTSASTGDQVLANAILRMRDSMTHYEFHHALADGDIGRALNIMAVSTHPLQSQLSILMPRHGNSFGRLHSPVLEGANIRMSFSNWRAISNTNTHKNFRN
jgi:hypothetical protein